MEAAPLIIEGEGEEKRPENICPSCGGEYIPGARFCNNCGTLLVQPKHIVEPEEINTSIRLVVIFFAIELLLCCIVSFTDWFTDSDQVLFVDGALALATIIFCAIDYKHILPLLKFKPDFKKVAIIIPVTILSSLVINVLVTFINETLFHKSTWFYYSFLDYKHNILAMFLIVAVSPAIFEELAYRGFLQTRLQMLTGKTNAVFISAFAFAIIHLSILSIWWLFPIGLVFGYFRSKYNTLWYGTIIHFLFNATAVGWELIQLNTNF